MIHERMDRRTLHFHIVSAFPYFVCIFVFVFVNILLLLTRSSRHPHHSSSIKQRNNTKCRRIAFVHIKFATCTKSSFICIHVFQYAFNALLLRTRLVHIHSALQSGIFKVFISFPLTKNMRCKSQLQRIELIQGFSFFFFFGVKMHVQMFNDTNKKNDKKKIKNRCERESCKTIESKSTAIPSRSLKNQQKTQHADAIPK